MFELLFRSAIRFAGMCCVAVGQSFARPSGKSLRRVAMLVLLVPPFVILQLVNCICLALDCLLFPSFRRVRIVSPVFIVGIPRSGTTFLHRVLAIDDASTTLTAWECLFAPSILQRHVVRGAARIDALIGRPLGRSLSWLERRLTSRLQKVHATGLSAPEEDFLTLLPVLGCFLLIVPFPESRWVWRLGRFDLTMPLRTRQQFMEFYRGLVQRHLYFHGACRRFLSKNPSFSPMVRSLRETFPSCRIVACLRDPVEAVPSQLSALRDPMTVFGHDPSSQPFRDRFLAQMAWYYEHLLAELSKTPGNRQAIVLMPSLMADIGGTVTALYRRFELPLPVAFQCAVAELDAAARSHSSGHRYEASAFGLSEADIRDRFAAAYRGIGTESQVPGLAA